MTDIRKREGATGVTYQVRYRGANGYEYKTFDTLKEARHYVEFEMPRHRGSRHASIRTVDQAVDKWLEVCQHEGRHGKDPVSKATLEGYEWRASVMKRYRWRKELHQLEAADVVAFRSWLLKNYTRDQAKKVLSSFHSVLLEMVAQGVLTTDPAAQITIQQSRYREPVQIPSIEEMKRILRAADELANDRNYWIAKAWQRYRPLMYLAADSGLRPQEYLALPTADVLKRGVRVTQAVDRSNMIGPVKTRAGRRFIPVGKDTLDMVTDFVERWEGENVRGLCFPGEHGTHQSYNNYLRRGWYVLMEKAGLVEEYEAEDEDEAILKPMYTPYSLRHFFASMLIAQNVDLKTLQERMGHEDAAMTLNVYGHLIRQRQAESDAETAGIVSGILAA